MDVLSAVPALGGLRVASRRSLATMGSTAAIGTAGSSSGGTSGGSTGGGGTGGPPPTWHLLDFRAETQSQPNWCWLTLGLSVHKWFDRTAQLSQCQVAGHMLSRSDSCANPSSEANNVGGHVYDVLGWLGNLNGSDRGEVALADLKGQIDGHRPVSTDVWWAGGGGHSVAVAGYASDGTLSIEDPVSGTVTIAYQTFTTSYQGDGDWGDSYYTQPSRIGVGGGRANPGSCPALVTRAPGQLDAFVIGTDGHVYTAAWNAGVAGGAWLGWWQVGTLQVPVGGAVTAVSRAADQLDIFAVGTDGHIYTAAWNQNVAQGKWQGWWQITNGLAKPGAPVGAVARAHDQLDVFVAGTDGHVYTAAWNQNVAQGKWQGWWPVGTITVPQGAAITAVARASDQLDIFAIDGSGQVCTAAWNQNVASGHWQGWWTIAAGRGHPGSAVGAVARMANQLDVVVTGTDGHVYTAAWNQNVAQGKWQGWWVIAGMSASQGAPVTIAARAPDQLDVFVAGSDGLPHTAAWNQNVAQGKWQGWWRVTGSAKTQTTAYLACVTRNAHSLDVFYIDDGGNTSAAAWDQTVANAIWRG